jgi:preprotein translocase subunit SecE
MTNPFVKIRGFVSEVITELKKSSWPTRKELLGSTVVVIITMLVLGMFVALADLVLVKAVGLLLHST